MLAAVPTLATRPQGFVLRRVFKKIPINKIKSRLASSLMPDGGASGQRIVNIQDFICFFINDDDLLANFGRFETTFERFPNFSRVSGLSGTARQTLLENLKTVNRLTVVTTESVPPSCGLK